MRNQVWLDRTLGPDNVFSLEDRLLNAIMICTAVFCTLAFVSGLILLGNTSFPIYSLSICLIFYVLYAIGRRKPSYKFLVTPYFALYLFAIVVIWYLTGGITGHTMLYFVSLLMIIPIFVRSRKRIYAIASVFSLLIGLFLHELKNPENLMSIYPDKKTEMLDTFITASFLGLIACMVMILIKYSYNKQKSKAERLSKAKDKFMSIIAHDLKGPMASMVQLGKMLMDHDQKLEAKDRKEFIEHIYSCSNETHFLLDNLLIWARTESQDLAINPKTLNLLSCIDESSKTLMECLRRKDIELNVEVSQQHTVFADPNMLMTVVRNLLSNAIKYTEKGGKISICSAANAGNQLSLTIQDNGIGISKDRQASLLDSEIHISTEGTSREVGSGLGLNVCKDFVEKNKGQISFSSEVNKGTTFLVSLPMRTN